MFIQSNVCVLLNDETIVTLWGTEVRNVKKKKVLTFL